jgi:hypothetical protein
MPSTERVGLKPFPEKCALICTGFLKRKTTIEKGALTLQVMLAKNTNWKS